MDKVLIIAECGINHNGSLRMAHKMIEHAKAAGADIAKFQHYDAHLLLGEDHPLAGYAASCQFTRGEHEQLKQHCDDIGIEYLVTVFDYLDVEWANKLCKRHKIASRMNTNPFFIERLLETGKPCIMSVNENTVIEPRLKGLDLMYCITKYPTPLEEMGPAVVRAGEVRGLSSHCPSIVPSLAAVARGAKILENHVTFDRSMSGCDQGSSITFDELKQMVSLVREMERMA